MAKRVKAIGGLLVALLLLAGCGNPPSRKIDLKRELPDPDRFVGDWKSYKELGKRHSEQAYKLSEVSRKVYHFDMAIVAFRKAKSLRESALREVEEPARPSVQREIDLIQGYLETCYRDRPVYYGPSYRPDTGQRF